MLNKIRLSKGNRAAKLSTMLLIMLSLTIGFSSCSGGKRATKRKAAKELAQKKVKAKADLLSIINNEGNMTLDEKEFKLEVVKRMNLKDKEIDALIVKAEDIVKSERALADKLKKEAEDKIAKENKDKEATKLDKYAIINNSMDKIANATSVIEANTEIQRILVSFANEEVPVLILLSNDGSIKDYDRPTTIKKYLEFVKDQRRSLNKVLNAEYDNNNKIKELELIKK